MRPLIPATLLLFTAAVPAGAAEFVPLWATDVIWSSNVFRTLDEDEQGRKLPKEDDFSVRTGPDLRFREQQGDLRYDLLYQLRYEEFVRLNGISEFDQFATGNVDWAITDRIGVSAYDNFAYASSLGGLFDFLPAQQVTPIVRAVRQRITSNSAGGAVHHRISPLWDLTISGDNQFYDYGDDINSQSVSTSGSVQITRGVTRRLVMGLGGMAERQESSDDLGATDGGSTFFQAFGIANYQFSRTLHLNLSAGPALSMPDQEDPGAFTLGSFLPFDPSQCPVRPDGVPFVPGIQAAGFRPNGDQCAPSHSNLDNAAFLSSPVETEIPFVGDTGLQNNLTYFARFNLEKQWHVWRGLLSYSRSATNASGLGTSTLVDSFFGQLLWTPSIYWTVTLNGTLAIQSAISEARAQEVAVRPGTRTVIGNDPITGQPAVEAVAVSIPFEVSSGEKIDNPIDIRTYRFELRVERRFSKNLSSSASASWYQQTNSGQITDNARSEIRFLLGFVWKFDPIPL